MNYKLIRFISDTDDPSVVNEVEPFLRGETIIHEFPIGNPGWSSNAKTAVFPAFAKDLGKCFFLSDRTGDGETSTWNEKIVPFDEGAKILIDRGAYKQMFESPEKENK